MSFFPEDRLAPVQYQLWDENQKFLGLFETKREAHEHAKKEKLKKYTVIGVCMTS